MTMAFHSISVSGRKMDAFRTTLVLISMALPASALAADKKITPAPLPVCTGSDSLLEVLCERCTLQKGVKIYGDLTGIPTGGIVGLSVGSF